MNESAQRTCKWCENEIPQNRRSDAQFCSDKCRYAAHNAEPCIYCGQRANSRDHVIPKRMREVLELRYGPNWGRFFDVPNTVPACLECNQIAGAKLFPTISAKRRYIQKRLEVKYKKLLEAPDWEDDEISELGYSLKIYIQNIQIAKDIMRERLLWKGGKTGLSRKNLRRELESIARERQVTVADVIHQYHPEMSLFEIQLLLQKEDQRNIEEGDHLINEQE